MSWTSVFASAEIVEIDLSNIQEATSAKYNQQITTLNQISEIDYFTFCFTLQIIEYDSTRCFIKLFNSICHWLKPSKVLMRTYLNMTNKTSKAEVVITINWIWKELFGAKIGKWKLKCSIQLYFSPNCASKILFCMNAQNDFSLIWFWKTFKPVKEFKKIHDPTYIEGFDLLPTSSKEIDFQSYRRLV